MPEIVSFPVKRYSGGAIFFHWSMAALILFMAVSGLLFDDIPRSVKPVLINLHAACGTVVLAMLVLRFWWRQTHRPPREPASIPEWNRRLATLGHWLLYALMAFVPLVGLVYLFYRGLGIDFGLFQIASPVERTVAIARPLGSVHQLSAYALMVVASGHIVVALWHHFVRRDGLLLRMMPAPQGKSVLAAATDGK